MKDSALYTVQCGRPNPRTGRRPVRFFVHINLPSPFQGESQQILGLVEVTMNVAMAYNLRRTKHDGAVRIDPHQVLYDQTKRPKAERPLPHHKITTLRSL